VRTWRSGQASRCSGEVGRLKKGYDIRHLIWKRGAYLLLGGAVFWLTDAAFFPLGGIVPPRLWIVAKTLFIPLAVFVTTRKIIGLKRRDCSPAVRSFLMLTGVWVLGPVYFLLVNRATAASSMSLGEVLFHLALFPLTTIISATYSGALGALVVSSAILCLFGMFSLYRD
jgi:hypothetical protein